MSNKNNCRNITHHLDSKKQTYGCRHSNPDICAKNLMPGVCAFVRNDNLCLRPPISWAKKLQGRKGWVAMVLNEVCELIVDCEHKTAPTQKEGYPSIRTPNVGRGRLILDKVNRVSEEIYKESSYLLWLQDNNGGCWVKSLCSSGRTGTQIGFRRYRSVPTRRIYLPRRWFLYLVTHDNVTIPTTSLRPHLCRDRSHSYGSGFSKMPRHRTGERWYRLSSV